MTGLTTPLTSAQYARLRAGGYASDYLLTLCKNRVVFKARLSASTAGQASWSFINYDTVTVGSYSAIEEGQAILFNTVDNVKTATYRGRVRYDAVFGGESSATTVYVNESSKDFAIGTYIWVLDTYDLTQRLSFFDMNGVEAVDFNWPYQGDPPIAPTLRTAYVGDCDSGTGKLRIAFDVSDAYCSTAGATISSYLFSFKAGTDTVISGSKSTAIVTVDLTPGEQWGKLFIIDSNGVAWTRRFYIFAHDANNPYDAAFERVNWSDNLSQGWTLSGTGFSGVDDVLPNTFGVLSRSNEQYGGVSYSLSTNNIAFVGWVQGEDDTLQPDSAVSVLSDATFQMTGFAARLARLDGQKIGVGFSAPLTAGLWGYNANASPWRAVVHYLAYYTTALNLAGIAIDAADDTFLYPSVAVTGENALDLCNSTAKTINAALAFAGDGRLRFERDAGHLSSTDRLALPVFANYTAADCTPTSLHNDIGSYGLVDADGLYYNATTTQVNAYKVRGPGLAMGEAQGRGTLSGQILAATASGETARNELGQRANDELEMLNTSEVLTVKFTDGHNYLLASRGQVCTFTLDTTIADASGVHRIVYTTADQWLCEGVQFALAGNGAVDITGTFRKLSRQGEPTYLDMTQGPDTNTDLSVPDVELPAFDFQIPEATFPDDATTLTTPPLEADPPTGTVAKFDGSELIVASTTKVLWLKKIISLAKPIALDITPSDLGSYQVKAVAVDPVSTKTTVGAYVLASDGTNSAIWHTTNAAQSNPVWTKGGDLTGVYTVLRGTQTAGSILLYNPGIGSSFSDTYDFTTGLHGWTIVTNSGNPMGTYSAGNGIQSANTSGSLGTRTDADVFKYVYLVNPTIEVTINVASLGNANKMVCNTNLGSLQQSIASTGVHTYTFNPVGTVTQIEADVNLSGPSSTGGSAKLTRIVISGSTSGARVALSTDYGATSTFGPVAATPGTVGGFDVQRAGTVSYAAAAGAVYKATTLGGAYSSWYSVPSSANPVCIIIPYFQRNSSTRCTTGSTPDCIIACDNGKWYWIAGSTATGTEITPTAGLVPSNADCLSIRFGNEIACWGTVGGLQKLYKSTNGGTSWSLVATIANAGKLRCRRDDNRPSPNGQAYLVQGATSVIDYTSTWFSGASLYPRALPVSNVFTFDTVY